MSHARNIPLRTCLPLVLSFLSAFTAVVLIGIGAQRIQLSAKIAMVLPTKQDQIPDSIAVNQAGVVLHIPHVEGMMPSLQEDWAYLGWFKFKRPVVSDERVVLVAKYDPASKIRPGYSLALRGGSDGVRPMVYWQSDSAAGRWFTFPPVQLQTKEWYLFAISFRKGTLGVHLTSATSPKSVLPVGGYDVGADVVPNNSSELIVGSFANGKFRGRIGPQGIISAKDLTSELPGLLKRVAKSPGNPSEVGDSVRTVFWTNGQRDFGPSSLSIKVSQPATKSRGDDSDEALEEGN